MRLALISYEYPPDSALGGIGTYTRQAAILLSQRGHRVEVFAASPKRSGHFEEGKIGVNLLNETKRERFPEAVAKVFSERHDACGFEVVESPECFAEGHVIRQAYPHVPHVAKLHTPSELIQDLDAWRPRFSDWLRHQAVQARMIGGALRRFQRPRYTAHRPVQGDFSHFHRIERDFVRTCDLVVSPSQALADWAMREWSIVPARTMVVPNPYVPSERL